MIGGLFEERRGLIEAPLALYIFASLAPKVKELFHGITRPLSQSMHLGLGLVSELQLIASSLISLRNSSIYHAHIGKSPIHFLIHTSPPSSKALPHLPPSPKTNNSPYSPSPAPQIAPSHTTPHKPPPATPISSKPPHQPPMAHEPQNRRRNTNIDLKIPSGTNSFVYPSTKSIITSTSSSSLDTSRVVIG